MRAAVPVCLVVALLASPLVASEPLPPPITRSPLIVRVPKAPPTEGQVQNAVVELAGAVAPECNMPWIHRFKWAAHGLWIPGHDCAEPVDEPCLEAAAVPDWSFALDFLLISPRGNDFAYAYPACECVDEPDGAAAVLDFDYEPSYRVRGSKRFGAIWFDVTGWTLLAETADAVGTDADHVLRDLVFLSDPPRADFAAARNELKLTVIDADLRAPIWTTDWCDWQLFGGARVAWLDQHADFYFQNSDWGTASADVRGAGLRGGLQGTAYWGPCFFRARSAVSLLASRIDFDYLQHRAGGPRTVSEYHIDDDRLVPVLDLEFSVGYRFLQHWAVSVGYLYSAWFNVASPEDFVAAIHSGYYYGDVDDTLTFDGLFFRVEYAP